MFYLFGFIASYFVEEKLLFSTVEEFMRHLQDGHGFIFERHMRFVEESEIAEEALARGLVTVHDTDWRDGRCFCRLSPPPYFPP